MGASFPMLAFFRLKAATTLVPLNPIAVWAEFISLVPTRFRSVCCEAKEFRATQQLPLKTVGDIGMSNLELFVSQSNVFSGIQRNFEDADYVVFGVPFDVTSTYRTGARFGPNAIRQASLNIETCSLRSGFAVAGLDLRCDFLGLDLSHTTFMQLISEEVKPAKIIEVGTRSVCKDELAYAKKAGIDFLTSRQIIKEGSEQIGKKLKEKLAPYENVYLTVDMDVLDPAFAPAAQNPEPEGINTTALLDIVCALCDKRVVGFDVLEIAPMFDQGISAIVAAKVMFEMLCQLEKTRKS